VALALAGGGEIGLEAAASSSRLYVAGLLSWPVRKNLGCLVPVAHHILDTRGFLRPIALDR